VDAISFDVAKGEDIVGIADLRADIVINEAATGKG
jgi:hypothetical protein